MHVSDPNGAPPAADMGICSATGWQRTCCETRLEAIRIPEEDSRLHARARVDFGEVRIGTTVAAHIAGNFNIKLHVPRALQQQMAGNGLVGSVLGSARISADISARVGSLGGGQCRAADVYLFSSFHAARRDHWTVDLLVLRGSRLHVPLHSVATQGAKQPMHLVLDFNEDVAVRNGPIMILSRSVMDLWRSVRPQMLNLLVTRTQSLVAAEAATRTRAPDDVSTTEANPPVCGLTVRFVQATPLGVSSAGSRTETCAPVASRA